MLMRGQIEVFVFGSGILLEYGPRENGLLEGVKFLSSHLKESRRRSVRDFHSMKFHMAGQTYLQ